MNFVCKYLGGSHLYNLNTESSDIDSRGIFLHTDIKYIIGMDKFEHFQNIENGADEKYKEFRHYMSLLRKSNSEAVEALFNKNFTEISPLFKKVQDLKFELLDSEKLFKCLMGYMHGELKAANSVVTGRLGAKRKESIERFGFSKNNFCHLLRLGFCGRVFFKKGYFPVNIKEECEKEWDFLYRIKTEPQYFKVEYLNQCALLSETMLKEAFDKREKNFKFNENLANELIFEAYYPILKNHSESFSHLDQKHGFCSSPDEYDEFLE